MFCEVRQVSILVGEPVAQEGSVDQLRGKDEGKGSI